MPVLKKAVLPVLVMFFVLTIKVMAQQSPKEFVQTTGYLLYLPETYLQDTATKWPLVLFLHGSGESGNDVQKVALHGPPELAAKGKKFPFILVSPQSDKPGRWNVEMLYKLLQQIKKDYRVNDRKIYLTGLSMGGYGTWELAKKHPEEFAALAPVCAGGDTTETWKLRHIPVWAFHGAKDDQVLPEYGKNMADEARKYNKDVRFTLYPEANHNSWDLTYNNDSLYTWMLAQTKFLYTEKPLTHPEKYAGIYFNGKDTVKISSESNGLVAYPRRRPIPLKYGGDGLFFIQPEVNVDIRFAESASKVTGFLLLGDEKLFYRKQ